MFQEGWTSWSFIEICCRDKKWLLQTAWNHQLRYLQLRKFEHHSILLRRSKPATSVWSKEVMVGKKIIENHRTSPFPRCSMATFFCVKFSKVQRIKSSFTVLMISSCFLLTVGPLCWMYGFNLLILIWGSLPSAFSLYVPVFVPQNNKQHLKNIAWKLPTRNIHHSQTFIARGFRTARTWCGARRIGTRTRLLRPSGGNVFCVWFDPLNTLLARVLKNFVAKFMPWEYALLGVFVEVKSNWRTRKLVYNGFSMKELPKQDTAFLDHATASEGYIIFNSYHPAAVSARRIRIPWVSWQMIGPCWFRAWTWLKRTGRQKFQTRRPIQYKSFIAGDALVLVLQELNLLTSIVKGVTVFGRIIS